ncbi:MAG: hypothetical protein VZR73_17035, partial [Acutalibacteraceae bacterium]|nr:hypothetical protein [Acutalibacteraceae bacterium]
RIHKTERIDLVDNCVFVPLCFHRSSLLPEQFIVTGTNGCDDGLLTGLAVPHIPSSRPNADHIL